MKAGATAGDTRAQSRQRVRNVLLKEWSVLFRDPSNATFVTVLPLLVVAQGFLYVWLAENFAGDSLLASSLVQSALASLRTTIPAAGSLGQGDQLILMLLTQFNLWLLLIPTMIASSFAVFGIIEEKLTRSLEPLLATPVRTWELLLGKALSGAIPAVIITWVCGGVFIGGVSWLGWGDLVALVLTPAWLATLLLVNPAIAVLSFLLGVIGSSRARDTKNAQNYIVLIILPVIILIAVQVTGFISFNGPLTVALAALLFAIDYLVLRSSVRLFQRESILVKWR